jgi:hypothetical protein
MKMPPKALKMAVERVMETYPSADRAEIQNAVELGFRYEMSESLTHQSYVDIFAITSFEFNDRHDCSKAAQAGRAAGRELKATKLWRYLNGEQ